MNCGMTEESKASEEKWKLEAAVRTLNEFSELKQNKELFAKAIQKVEESAKTIKSFKIQDVKDAYTKMNDDESEESEEESEPKLKEKK